jgi:hypothetical protein
MKMSGERISAENQSQRYLKADFTQIKGIGSSIDQRLHEAGIRTYLKLALTSPEELASIFKDMPGLSPERIMEMNWIGQAKQISLDSGEDEGEISKGEGENSQHYSVFTIELLLDDENAVRRTRIMHVQSQEETSWAGWEESRLIQFLLKSAEVNVDDLYGVESTDPHPLKEKDSLANKGELQLGEIPLSAVKRDQPFRLPLILDMKNVRITTRDPLFYSSTVYVKKLGTGSRQLAGNAQGTLALKDQEIIHIPITALPGGHYRVEAFVNLSLSKERTAQFTDLVAMTEGAIYVT